ncbi:uncharacterized protein KZ484_003467 isoform 2-T2 [Pholidichthys leucotaenia]
MDVSSQDPALMAMDLSKTYSPLSRGHSEVMDLAKKPEWYHRRPPSCSTDLAASYRSRASSSFGSLSSQPGVQAPEPIGSYMNSALAPGLDLYHDDVHSSLWHPSFYRPDQSQGLGPESSGGEESDSGSDVIFLVSSAKEPLVCSPFIQDTVTHMVEPLSPTTSSLDEGRGCYHLPQPMSSPSADSSYSDESSDSSVDIPVHHTRPVVLLSEINAVCDNPADISSDDSDVVEVSVTKEKRNSCNTSPLSKSKTTPPKEVRRSARTRKSVSESRPFTHSPSRHSLKRRVKCDAVGIYNETFDSEDVIEYAVRVSSSDESPSREGLSERASSHSQEHDRKSPEKESQQPLRRALYTKRFSRKRKTPLTVPKAKKLRSKQNHRSPPQQHQRAKVANKKKILQRRRKLHTQTGPSGLFSPQEPGIKLKYAITKEGKKEKKVDGFCPFVHMEQRTCTVVNFQEEEETGGSSKGASQTSSTLSGFVPNTSCFQLGRLSSDGRCETLLQLCCLCGHTANAMGLGDLHGPYYRSGTSVHGLNCGNRQKEALNGLSNGSMANSSDDDCAAVSSLSQTDMNSPLHLDECWLHEDCGIWSTGVFLIRGKLYGLEEAARLAQETICSTCQKSGAIMGCFQKGCLRNYHYRCAIQSGCVLNEENFSMRCPEHKNKMFTSAVRQQKR